MIRTKATRSNPKAAVSVSAIRSVMRTCRSFVEQILSLDAKGRLKRSLFELLQYRATVSANHSMPVLASNQRLCP
jgi:hypothetical protein